MPWETYVEPELISKRFIIAVFLITIFAYTVITKNDAGMTVMAGIIGSVMGFYYGSKSQAQTVELLEP